MVSNSHTGGKTEKKFIDTRSRRCAGMRTRSGCARAHFLFCASDVPAVENQNATERHTNRCSQAGREWKWRGGQRG